MAQDELDKFIKSQVEQHNTNTDADLLWQKIQAKQKKKKKRRFFIFWLYGGFGLFLSLAFVYFFQFSGGNSNLLKGNSQTPIAEIAPPSKETRTDLTSKTNEKSETNLVEDKEKLIPNSTASDLEKSVSTLAESVNNTKEKEQSTIKNGFTDKEESIGLATIPTKNQEINQLPSQPNNSTPDLINSKEVKKESKKDEDEQLENSEKNELTSTITPEKEDSLVQEEEEMVTTDIEEKKEEEDLAPSESTEEVEDKKRKWSYSNGLAFTYGKAFRTLSSKNATELDYLKTRQDTETSLDAIRINFDFMLQNDNGLYLKTGLEYEQINERLDAYIEQDSVKDTPDQVIVLRYAMNGSTSQTLGNGEVVTTYWSQKKIFNRYSSVDIPVLVGYNSRRENKKLGWFVEGGASINLWFASKGQIFDNNNENGLISLGERPNQFKSQTGVSLLGSVGLTYQISDKLSIWTSPNIKYHLASITGKETPLDQKYLNAGLSMGVRCRWSE